MCIVIIAFLVILFTLISKLCSRPKNFPPGPRCFPFIGSWYSIPAQGIENRVPEWRKNYGNIIGHKVGARNLVLVTGYNETVSALKNINFQNRIHVSTLTQRTFYKVLGLFFGDGEQYHEVRRFTLRFLGQVSVAKLEPVMHDEMMEFFSTIKSGETIVVNSDFINFPLNAVFIFLVGNAKNNWHNEAKTFRELVYRSFKSGRPSGIENFYPIFKTFVGIRPQIEAIKFIQDFFQKQLKKHRESFDPNNIRDYIDAFLVEQEKEKEVGLTQYYTDEELLSCLLDLGSAASESSGNTIIFLLMYIVMNPQVQDKIHEELDNVVGNRFPSLNDKSNLPYCYAVIYESMRINTIAANAVQHVATEDTEFYGYTIPQGTMLIFPFTDIFLNPDEFDEPNSFKPERFSNEEVKNKVIAFGLGKRACVGELLSKNMMFLFVAYFFQTYRISLPKGCEYPNTEPELGFTNSPRPFKIVIEERQKN